MKDVLDVTMPNNERLTINIPHVLYTLMGPRPNAEKLIMPTLQVIYKNGGKCDICCPDQAFLTSLYELVLRSMEDFNTRDRSKY